MANRVLIGEHDTHGHGLYVSKSGADVTGSTASNLSFSSHFTDSNSGIVSLNGEAFNVYSKGYTDITIDQGDILATGDITWNRSVFNDGSTDRCPLIFCQVGKTSGDTPTTHWLPCILSQKNQGGDERAGYGYRYTVRPYYTTTTGLLRITVSRGVTESGTTNNDADIDFRAFYTLLYTRLN